MKAKNAADKKEKDGLEAKRREMQPDEDQLQKSQKILQAKSRFYDKMMASGGALNSDETCLVMFSEKRAHGDKRKANSSDDEKPRRRSSSSSSDSTHLSSDDDDDLPEDEQWVEYTDCLGRTRKCLKKDLEFFKKKDNDLAREPAAEEYREPSHSPEREPNVPSLMNTNVLTLPPIDGSSKLEDMRKNWEEKAIENADRDEIHYQDVLFDEARSHGVGYFQFSQDEKQRAVQQEQLAAERERTMQSQKQREEQIKNREKIIAERVRAAKNRQRERAGLPRLEDDPLEEEIKEKKERRAEEKQKRKEREREEQLEAEIRRNAKKRRQHLRPWDKDKDGGHGYSSDDDQNESKPEEWSYKPEREPMSQAQWNAMQRDVRNQEFAPPSSTATRFGETDSGFGAVRAARVRRNVDADVTPEPSLSEASASSASYDYYNNFKLPPKKTGSGDLEQNIAAGLRFLREQADKSTLNNKHTWTQKADY